MKDPYRRKAKVDACTSMPMGGVNCPIMMVKTLSLSGHGAQVAVRTLSGAQEPSLAEVDPTVRAKPVNTAEKTAKKVFI